jgi:hypothetical protein
MRRREFLSLVGSATVWPLGARAQISRTAVIGLLSPESSSLGMSRVCVKVFESLGTLKDETLNTSTDGRREILAAFRRWLTNLSL